MQGAFIQAITFCPPSILDRPLYPLSSFHGLILESAGSFFICGGRSDLDDIIFGVWVCSHKFADGYRGVADIKAAQKWGRRLKDRDLEAAGIKFREYIDAAFTQPEYWKSGESSSIRAPYWWHLAFFGMSKLHLSEADAWDYPVAKLACFQACWAENEGSKDLMSAEEIQARAKLPAEEKKAKGNK
ncbi:MAG: hypothetical protein PHI33_01640 [Smithellaceae bacterium]|nr:hypothetical protein [Smithellaceae bacterium]